MAEWNPWQEMERVRREIDRAFEQVGGRNGGRTGRTFPTAFLPGRAARAYPLVNVSEDANALYVTALAPGLEPTAIQLTVQQRYGPASAAVSMAERAAVWSVTARGSPAKRSYSAGSCLAYSRLRSRSLPSRSSFRRDSMIRSSSP